MRPERWSLRVRMVMLAGVAVTVVLAGGGLLLGLLLRDALVDDLRQAALLRARDLAALASDGSVPDPVPIGDSEEALVQVVAGNEVVAASANVTGTPPLSVAIPAPGRSTVTEVESLPVDDGDDAPFLVAATTAAGQNGPVTVYVAASLEDSAETVARVRGVALAGLPVLVVVLASAMWLIVGRTLAPVEAIRAEADSIGSRELDRRVPEPPGDDEIARLARTLNRMLARLEAGSDRERRFVADAAHELRTPISTLRTRVETARTSSRDVDWREVADDVLAETARLQRVTEQLLVLARADAGAVARDPVDLDDVVVRALRDRDHEVALELSPIQVRGDTTLLVQAVHNLLDNAREHGGDRVAVTLEQVGATARLVVEDDGPGIPVSERAAVLERFTRLDLARSRSGGSGGAGLGLALVADIAAAHGGSVRVTESRLGGARIELELPVAEDGPA